MNYRLFEDQGKLFLVPAGKGWSSRVEVKSATDPRTGEKAYMSLDRQTIVRDSDIDFGAPAQGDQGGEAAPSPLKTSFQAGAQERAGPMFGVEGMPSRGAAEAVARSVGAPGAPALAEYLGRKATDVSGQGVLDAVKSMSPVGPGGDVDLRKLAEGATPMGLVSQAGGAVKAGLSFLPRLPGQLAGVAGAGGPRASAYPDDAKAVTAAIGGANMARLGPSSAAAARLAARRAKSEPQQMFRDRVQSAKAPEGEFAFGRPRETAPLPPITKPVMRQVAASGDAAGAGTADKFLQTRGQVLGAGMGATAGAPGGLGSTLGAGGTGFWVGGRVGAQLGSRLNALVADRSKWAAFEKNLNSRLATDFKLRLRIAAAEKHVGATAGESLGATLFGLANSGDPEAQAVAQEMLEAGEDGGQAAEAAKLAASQAERFEDFPGGEDEPAVGETVVDGQKWKRPSTPPVAIGPAGMEATGAEGQDMNVMTPEEAIELIDESYRVAARPSVAPDDLEDEVFRQLRARLTAQGFDDEGADQWARMLLESHRAGKL